MDKLPGLREAERTALWKSRLRICYDFMTPQGCNRGEQCEYEHKKLSAVLAQLGYRRQRDQLEEQDKDVDDDEEEEEEEEAA